MLICLLLCHETVLCICTICIGCMVRISIAFKRKRNLTSSLLFFTMQLIATVGWENLKAHAKK